MKLPRRKFLRMATIAAAMPAISRTAIAQSYPSRPIIMIVPYPAGGPTDVIARVVANRMRTSLGQNIVVENTSGAANGSLGIARLVHAAPDGYTLGIGHWGSNVINGAIYTLSYDLVRDLEPLALITTNPVILVGKNALTAKNLRDLVAWLKANPDKAFQGTAGIGSPPHIAGVFFQKLTETKYQFVHYRGGAPSMQDLLGGQIDLLIPQPPIVLPYVREGKIRAYAVTAKKRLDVAPDIPTAQEAGVPGFAVSVWHGLWVPKATPKPAIAKLNAAVVEALADPAVKKALTNIGQDTPAREDQTPEALATFQKAEIEKWWPIIKEANIEAE